MPTLRLGKVWQVIRHFGVLFFGAILNYLFFWTWIVMHGSLSTGKSIHNFNINILECHWTE
jgi:hypothetical protein